jgi:hypothetical protein
MGNINSMAAHTRADQISRILKAGICYFVIVFVAGFILGPIRILLIVPRLGERAAELMEAPLMLFCHHHGGEMGCSQVSSPIRSY